MSDFNISMWLLIPAFFAASCTSTEAENSGCRGRGGGGHNRTVKVKLAVARELYARIVIFRIQNE